MSRRGLAFFAVLAFAAAAAFSLGSKDSIRDGQAVLVSGTLRRVGNEPFSRLVVTDAEGRDWYVAEGEEPALAMLEQRQVSVEAILRIKSMTLADGRKLPDRRELTKIRLLE